MVELTARAVLAAAVLALSARLAAQGEGGARGLLDAYLTTAAATQPEYRTEVRAGGTTPGSDAGRQTGCGPVLGPFTFRARTYAELTLGERREVLRDPRLRAFLLARNPGATPRKGPATKRFSISPATMLDGRPFAIELSP